jgi:TolB-like protein
LDAKTNAKFEGVSVHHQDYVKFEKYQVPAPHKEPDFVSARDDRDFNSTHHADFKNFGKQEKVKYIIPGKNLEARSNVKFEGQSVHKQDFKKFEKYQVPAPHKEPDFVSATEDRDFNSTHHADFKNFGKQEKVKYIIPEKNLEAKNAAKFEGVSVNKQDFKKWENYKRPAGRPVVNYISSPEER